MDVMTDSGRSNLWIINTDGSDHRPLLSGRKSFSSPRWSPDGKRLAFVSGAEGSPQLYVRWMDSGGRSVLVVDEPESAVTIIWLLEDAVEGAARGGSGDVV